MPEFQLKPHQIIDATWMLDMEQGPLKGTAGTFLAETSNCTDSWLVINPILKYKKARILSLERSPLFSFLIHLKPG